MEQRFLLDLDFKLLVDYKQELKHQPSMMGHTLTHLGVIDLTISGERAWVAVLKSRNIKNTLLNKLLFWTPTRQETKYEIFVGRRLIWQCQTSKKNLGDATVAMLLALIADHELYSKPPANTEAVVA